jgi:hypothetical protein
VSEALVVPTRLPSGAILRVEARRIEGASVDTGPVDRDAVARPGADLGLPALRSALQGIEELTGEISAVIDRVSPSEATVEFDVELVAEAGQLTALLVKGSGKATFKFTLNWKRAPG